MSRRAILGALLVAACSSGSNPTANDSGTPAPDAGDPDAGLFRSAYDAGPGGLVCPSDGDLHPVNGQMVVRTGIVPGSPSNPTVLQVRVLLGDGTRFDLPVDDGGVVVFSDPSLSGAQTVTRVFTEPTQTRVSTVAGVNVSTLCFPEALVPNGASQTFGAVSGAATGGAAGDATTVELVGGFSGGADAGADGSFSITPTGYPGAPGALFAADSTATAFGFRPDVIPAASPLGGQDVALDHAESQQIAVTFQGVAPYVDAASRQVPAGRVDYTFGGQTFFFGTSVQAQNSPVPQIPPTGSFSSVEQVLDVSSGASRQAPYNRGHVAVPVSGPSITVTFPTPLEVTYPDFSDGGTQALAPAAGFHVAWVADPQSQAVSLDLSEGSFYWSVAAPASAQRFDFFNLPADASPTPNFYADGGVGIHVTQFHSADRATFEDWVDRAPPSQYSTPNSFWAEIRKGAQLQ